MKRRVVNHTEAWESRIPFRISNYVWDDYPAVVCEIEQDGVIGQGEALGVYYLDETEKTMLAQLEAISDDLAGGASRDDLLELLPPGGARNAADAALWDLEAQLAGTSAWELAGVKPEPVHTVFTIGLEDEPEQMAAGAAAATDVTLLKIKLNNDRPVERIAAIRKARPDVRLVVDVNQGWTFDELRDHLPALEALGVARDAFDEAREHLAGAALHEGAGAPVVGGADRVLPADRAINLLDELGADEIMHLADLVGGGAIPGPQTIATLRRGQSFGEVALVDEGLRSASAVVRRCPRIGRRGNRDGAGAIAPALGGGSGAIRDASVPD